MFTGNLFSWRRGAVTVVTLAILLLGPFLLSADQPVPDGPEFILETPGYGSRAAADGAGNFVIVWNATLSPLEIRAQRFDSIGAPQGTPFTAHASSTSPYFAGDPDVAMTGEGGFVVTWNDVGRRFDAAGQPDGELFFLQSIPLDDVQFPKVASNAAGEFVVTWVKGYLWDYPGYVDAQPFDATGEGKVLGFEVGNADYYSRRPDVGLADSGEFVVIWSECCNTSSPEVFGQRFNGSGQPQEATFVVNQGDHFGSNAAMAMSGSGEFAVAWVGEEQSASAEEVFLQRFDSVASPVGPKINASTENWELTYVSLARDALGGAVVVWSDESWSSEMGGIFGRRYDAMGNPDGAAFQVSTSEIDARGVDIGMDAAGNFMVTWGDCPRSCGRAGPGSVLARRFCGPLRLTSPVPQAVCEGQPASFEIGATGRSPLDYQWRHDGLDLIDGGPVSGAESPLLIIGSVTMGDAGNYDNRVDDSCATPDSAISDGALLTVLPAAAEIIELTVNLAGAGTDLQFNWSDDPDAADYVVFEDGDPSGEFVTESGTATSGTSGLSLPVPSGLRFYLVAGRNPTCGLGPKRTESI